MTWAKWNAKKASFHPSKVHPVNGNHVSVRKKDLKGNVSQVLNFVVKGQQGEAVKGLQSTSSMLPCKYHFNFIWHRLFRSLFYILYST